MCAALTGLSPSYYDLTTARVNFFRAYRFFAGFAGVCVAAFYRIAVFPRVLAVVRDTRRGGNAGGG